MRTSIALYILAPAMALAQMASQDGSCGRQNNDTICGDWMDGDCCSMYGYCGKTPEYCGWGCQSGNCTAKPYVAPKGFFYSMDGSCGATVLCGDWMDGSCCSAAGWCGKTEDYCGVGCLHGACLAGGPADNTSMAADAPLFNGTAAAPVESNKAADVMPLGTGVADVPMGAAPAMDSPMTTKADPSIPTMIPPFANTTLANNVVVQTITPISMPMGTAVPVADSVVQSEPEMPAKSEPMMPATNQTTVSDATPMNSDAAATFQPTRENTPAPPGKIWAIDGGCSADKLCGPWESGSCCSSMGWCGAAEAYCGTGCQSGGCNNMPAAFKATASTMLTSAVETSTQVAAENAFISIASSANSSETMTVSAFSTESAVMGSATSTVAA